MSSWETLAGGIGFVTLLPNAASLHATVEESVTGTPISLKEEKIR